MKKFIRWAARKLGMVTWYHVSAVYRQDSHMGTTAVSLLCGMKPWLHDENHAEMTKWVESQVVRPASTPVITSITKLGL